MDKPSSEETLRETLVNSLLDKRVITNPDIAAAFRKVPRHVFLPDTQLEQAYADQAVPVKHDSSGMVISSASQPTMMALMLTQLDVQPGHTVLEIGTATGYNAAIMKEIVGEAGSVTTIELDKDLARQAEHNLHHAGITDVRVVQADGARGYAPRAAYDRIISTVGVWDVPAIWWQQLKPNGRLVAPIWLDGVQVSATFTRRPDGTFFSRDNRPCAFVYLRGEAAGPSFHKQIGSTSLNLLADDVGNIDTAALHLLLSDDHEINHLEHVLTPQDYWMGLQLYLMLNEPDGHIFAVYDVLGTRQVYGLEGRGIALFGAASAAFIPYEGKGTVHTYAGADAFLALQNVVDAWHESGRPGVQKMNLRLIPKAHGEPAISYGKLYSRRDHYLYAWIDA